ncbi:expressed unknown protein [Seminavis robusta]|uniref:DUF6824 domain-containing protein n=1 Tax=Seminavis robusta TaxID=568900 RepID=A0A9N8E5T9_9STRA|nr:expressed unknown protein [Seminavis robusta]|eukprot:Sro684_g186700.1 n/a (250) ;mRNA; r:6096-7125
MDRFQEENRIIDHPLDSDILCGKNKACLDHPGSVEFRSIIEQNAQRYREADSKFMKMEITKQLYNQIRRQSVRFLKFNHSKKNGWQELTSSQVRDKIGHALRFVNRRKRRKNRATKKISEAAKVPTHRRRMSYDSSTTQSTSSESMVSSDDADETMDSNQVTPARKAHGLLTTNSRNDQFVPVTKMLRGLSKSLLSKIPQTISFNEGWQSQTNIQNCLEMGEFSERDVLSMMRQPVMDFEPQSVKPVWL